MEKLIVIFLALLAISSAQSVVASWLDDGGPRDFDVTNYKDYDKEDG